MTTILTKIFGDTRMGMGDHIVNKEEMPGKKLESLFINSFV